MTRSNWTGKYFFESVELDSKKTMSLQERFDAAAAKVKAFSKKPSDTELLTLYGLFKQGTVGDVNTDRPGIFSMTDRAKWDSWKKNEGLWFFLLFLHYISNFFQPGMSKDDAMEEYIKFADQLAASYQ